MPSAQRAHALSRCLDALALQERPADQIVVVVQAGDRATEEVVSSRMGALPVQVAFVTRPGLVTAYNKGLEQVDGDIVAFTDDDARPHRDWLQRIENHFKRDPDVGGLGGRDHVHFDGQVDTGRAEVVGRLAWYGRIIGNHHLGVGPPREVEVLKGVNMAFRSAALGSIGFDSRLRTLGTEHAPELGATFGVLARGWRIVYDPAVAVDHEPQPRRTGAERTWTELDDVRFAAYNEALATLGFGALWNRVGFMVWALLCGTRNLPGPLQAIRVLLLERRWIGTHVAATLRGRLEAWRTTREAPPMRRVLAIAHSDYGATRARQLLARQRGVAIVHAGPGLRGVVRALLAILGRRAPVVYLVDIGESTACAALLARLLGRKVVVDTGDLAYELAQSVGGRSWLGLALVRMGERLALACADHVVVRGTEHLRLLPTKAATVVPDLPPEGLDPTSGPDAREDLGLEDRFVVGLVGSLNYSERLGVSYGWDVVEALSHLPSEFEALIVGDGDGLPWLRARAASLGVGDRCHFVGRVPPSLVGPFVRAMDVAVSTQSADRVGSVRTTGKLPLYLACGCPVLTSHVGEAARLLGPLGWTLPYSGTIDRGYPVRLAARLRDWSADRSGAARRQSQALTLAETAFDASEMQNRLCRVLQAVGADCA